MPLGRLRRETSEPGAPAERGHHAPRPLPDVGAERACRIVGQHRSTQRRPVTRGKGDDALRARLHAFSRKHKRWGYRKAWAVLRDEGWDANRKKIQRLWREEGLKVPHRKTKRQRVGTSTCPADRLRA